MVLVVGLALLGVCGVYLYRRFVPVSATGTTRPPLERPEGGLVKGFAGQISVHTRNQSLSVLLNGLQMGSQPLADMTLQEKTTGTFLRPNDRGDVLGVPVESIQYIFNDGKRLWSVVHNVSASNAVPLLTAMKREFGEPDWTDKDGYPHWYEPKGDYEHAVLLVGYSVETGEAGVLVMSGPLNREYVKATYAAALAASSNEPEGSTANVYEANFNCAMADHGFPIVICLQNSSLKVRRGINVKVYDAISLVRQVDRNAGITLDLPSNFEIEVQNTGEPGMQLKVVITNQRTKKTVFEDIAARGRWIHVKN
jgi:hypothetical protein